MLGRESGRIMPIFIFNYNLPTCSFIAVRKQKRTRNQPTALCSRPPPVGDIDVGVCAHIHRYFKTTVRGFN